MQEFGTEECKNATSVTLFEALIENRTTLVKTAARITGCHSRAEDVVQEAYLRLSTLKNIKLPLKAQLNYVFRIVRNLSIDHYRRQVMELKYSGSEEEGLNASNPADTPEATNLHLETLEIIDAALKELPERTCYAFVMYRLHGVQQKDIAKELGVSPTLVNFMIRDALVHFRKALAIRNP
jgi:RNA polymerase sigma factor (sigma-70 family)